MDFLVNLLLGILSIVVTVVVGFIIIAVLVWLLGIVGFSLPGDVESGLKLLIVLIALIQGVSLLLGRPRWYRF